MGTTTEIAREIKDLNEFIVLIYAFNGTGKTRLSVEYKNITKAENGDQHSGVYYNAFSEDLFTWDNDEENGNANFKLDVRRSSLNGFFSLLTEDSIREELQYYYPSYEFRFNASTDPSIAIESITFFKEKDEDNLIKISRGEERIFIWCFFLALFKVEGWTDTQKEHIFIDDPVSSLDDNNVYITANTVMDLIDNSFDERKSIIITTHHIGFFSVLYDRIKRGEKASRYERNSKVFMLVNDGTEINLKRFEKEIFLFHLHLLKTLNDAKKSILYTYHFVLLRQLLENISSFMGTSQIKVLLGKIKVDNPEQAIMNLNSLSHKKVFVPQFKEMDINEKQIFNEIFDKLIDKYDFNF